MPNLIIDGQSIDVSEDTTVLQAIRQAGVHLPTLCYWEGLPPYGACRLCLVEVTAPESKLVAACAYPAGEDMVIETHGPRVTAIRKIILEFMLTRCPTSDVIRTLAAEDGVTETRFPTNGKADELCILCGLCVRVCRDAVGATAIGFIGRGAEREVGSPFRLNAEACIGCGACAAVCPTDAIKIEDVDGERILHTWNTSVRLQPCPECGQPFAPEPMAFLGELVEASEHLMGVCPACRRKDAAAELDVIREASIHVSAY
jgi:NADH dehydrogenase/NADH:ubiquinone oxidoreductase subunit G